MSSLFGVEPARSVEHYSQPHTPALGKETSRHCNITPFAAPLPETKRVFLSCHGTAIPGDA